VNDDYPPEPSADEQAWANWLQECEDLLKVGNFAKLGEHYCHEGLSIHEWNEQLGSTYQYRLGICSKDVSGTIEHDQLTPEHIALLQAHRAFCVLDELPSYLWPTDWCRGLAKMFREALDETRRYGVGSTGC
jgi:hypothetical protein